MSAEHRAKVGAANLRHGLSVTPTYKSYIGARSRCNNPRAANFKDYGGRGIRFLYPNILALVADIGLRRPGTSIGRIDSDGHYEPGNCGWENPKEQMRNRRNGWVKRKKVAA